VKATGARYAAVVCRWDGGWQAFVLDSTAGLIGVVEAAGLEGVEPAVRAFLGAREARPPAAVRVEFVRPGPS